MKVQSSDISVRRYTDLPQSYCKLTVGKSGEVTLLMTDDEGRALRDQLISLYGMSLPLVG